MSNTLSQIQDVLEQRKSANPETSYTAQLLHKGEDKSLKKVIEEAGDGGGEHLIYETADLWFHNMILLAHHGLRVEQVLEELTRRQGLSDLVEKTNRTEK